MEDKAKAVNFTMSRRKITAPPLPPTIVSRPILVQRLTEAIVSIAHYKLILLHAPAGYGKTTLLAEFARQSELPCCWSFLERGEADPLTFLRLLLASLRQCFPTFGTQLVPLLNDASTNSANSGYPLMVLEALMEAITHEIPGRFVLLLCHYQEVNTYSQVTALVEYLLHHLPEQCVLVLESREVPELDFASLLAGRAMLGIGQDLLRFSPQEIIELARVQGSKELSEEEAEELATAFDGWITGLLLGTQLGGVQFLQRSWNAPLPRKGQRMQMHTQTLFSYVVNEVFKRHQEVYAFLKEAVVLQEMTPSLCANLLKVTAVEANRRLQYLEQHGLFVTQNGEGTQPVYTCHPVLRDLLYEELRQQNPERFVQLHQRAAELLSANQQYEQAIYHALEAKVDEIAARLIIASAEQMMEQGHLEMLQQWIAAFSEATIARYPRLLLIQANISLRKGELDVALPLLEQLTRLLNGHSAILAYPEELPLLQAELAIARANVLNQQGEYQQVQQLCEQVLAHLPPDEVSLRANAHISLGGCAQYRGDLDVAIGHYQKALQLWGRHTVSRLTAGGHGSLAATYRVLGHFALAEHHSARATACWKQLQDTRGTVNNLIGRACLIWDQGRLDEAEELLKQALAQASSPLCLHRLQGYVLVNLGELSQDQGFYDRSLAQTEEGLAMARQLGDAYLLNYALLTLSLTYLYMGDAATASLLLSEMRLETSTDASASSEQHVQQELTQGTIWLHGRHYVKAYPLLEKSETTLRTMGLKREQLKVLVRLAACHLGQQQVPQALERLAEVEQILTASEAYEQRVRTEIRVLPSVQHAIEQRPECSSLRSLLHWKVGADELELGGETDPAFQESEPEVLSPTLTPSSPSSAFSIPASQLKILALGEPVVQLNEQPITRWRMARAMELCFYLLDAARPMRKEQIITALWEEADEQTSQTFYSTIHYLRKALGGEPTIRSRAGIYTLDLASIYGQEGVWYDVAAFEEQYTLGKQALAEELDEVARTAFTNMVELYRGDYVLPFYSDWCNVRRDKLRRLYLDARQQLAQIAWRAENSEESAEHWQQMLAVDTCLEEAHYGLMRCYIRLGKRGLALRQYQRCSETLQQELGAAPGTAIQNLYRRLMGLPKTETSSS